MWLFGMRFTTNLPAKYHPAMHIISPTGDTSQVLLDNRGNTIAEIDESGDTIHYSYDLNDNRIMAITSNGDTIKTSYNMLGNVTIHTDLRGNQKEFKYDVFGQLDTTFYTNGLFTTKTYDSKGRVVKSTDVTGLQTLYEYDSENRVVKTTYNDSSYTEVNYNSHGHRVATIAARFPSELEGDTTKYVYDAVGNNTAVITPLSDTTKYEYDAAGRRIAMIDALNHRTIYSYDDYDRLDTTIYHDGSFTVSKYDAIGRKVAEIDAEGNRTVFAYDTAGALVKVTDVLNQETITKYDTLGQKTALVDANGNVTNLVYDSLGRIVEKLYPAVVGVRDSEQFIYNDLNELIQKIVGTDTTDIVYDTLGRQILTSYRNSGHTVETFYGINGQIDSVVDYRGTTSYQYDNRGRQYKVTNPDGTFIEYSFDAAGNKIRTITSIDTTEFTYDALSRMKQVIKGTDTTEYYYNTVGNRDSVTYGNGTSIAYEYDELNRLTKVTNSGAVGQVLSSYEYVLNKAGIRTAVIEANGDSVVYSYDDLYRLTNERRTGLRGYEVTYTYDKVGSRKTKTKDGVLIQYEYNERDQITQEITGTDTIGYAYDKSGRLYAKYDGTGTTWYSWTDNNRLRQVVTPDTTIHYEYDFWGNKVKEGNKTLLIDYYQEYTQVIGEIIGTDTVSYTFGLERIAQERNGETHYYLIDGQGSIRQLTDTIGTVTDEYGYYAFGETLYVMGTTENSFRYTGESYDPNSGFYYLRARWMNPSLGRFVSVDPYAGDPMAPVSLHRYLYANQSPITMSDPSGLMTLINLLSSINIQGILKNTQAARYLNMLDKAIDTIDLIHSLTNTISMIEEFADIFDHINPLSYMGGAKAVDIATFEGLQLGHLENITRRLITDLPFIIKQIRRVNKRLLKRARPKKAKLIINLPSPPGKFSKASFLSWQVPKARIGRYRVKVAGANAGGSIFGLAFSIRGQKQQQFFRLDYHDANKSNTHPKSEATYFRAAPKIKKVGRRNPYFHYHYDGLGFRH